MNSLPKTVTLQRRNCDLNAGPSVPESSTLTTRLPSHPYCYYAAFKVPCVGHEDDESQAQNAYRQQQQTDTSK